VGRPEQQKADDLLCVQPLPQATDVGVGMRGAPHADSGGRRRGGNPTDQGTVCAKRYRGRVHALAETTRFSYGRANSPGSWWSPNFGSGPDKRLGWKLVNAICAARPSQRVVIHSSNQGSSAAPVSVLRLRHANLSCSAHDSRPDCAKSCAPPRWPVSPRPTARFRPQSRARS
jgi:hypothetical protein